jgi:hypothetical protein
MAQSSEPSHEYEICLFLGAGANRAFLEHAPTTEDLGKALWSNAHVRQVLRYFGFNQNQPVDSLPKVTDVFSSIDAEMHHIASSTPRGNREAIHEQLARARRSLTEIVTRSVNHSWGLPDLGESFGLHPTEQRRNSFKRKWYSQQRDVLPWNEALRFARRLYAALQRLAEKLPKRSSSLQRKHWVLPVAVITTNWDWGLDHALMTEFSFWNNRGWPKESRGNPLVDPRALTKGLTGVRPTFDGPQLFLDYTCELPMGEPSDLVFAPYRMAYTEPVAERHNSERPKQEGSGLDKWRPHFVLKFAKLHGSTNWTRCTKCNRLHMRWFYKLRQECWFCGSTLVPEPMIVTQTYLKEYSAFQLKHIWSEALSIVRASKKLMIAGFRMRPDDYAVRYLLSQARARDRNVQVMLGSKEDAHAAYSGILGSEIRCYDRSTDWRESLLTMIT